MDFNGPLWAYTSWQASMSWASWIRRARMYPTSPLPKEILSPSPAATLTDSQRRPPERAPSRHDERMVCKDGPSRHPPAIAQSERSRGTAAPVDLLLMPPTGVTSDSQEALSISPACGVYELSLIHISEPTRLGMISYAVFCL